MISPHALWSCLWVLSLLTLASSSSSDQTRRQRQLIVNGEQATRDRFPYFVSLRRYGAGVLIAPDIVLTAGHTKPRHKDHVQPHIGTYSYKDLADVEVVDILSAHRHENFTALGEDEFQHDFTILQLNQSIYSHAYPRLNSDDTVPGVMEDNLTILGLGVLGESTDERPKYLQQVSVQAISNDECESRHDKKRGISFHNRIVDTHMCTWSPPNNDEDACGYDSGGPIVIQGDSPEQDLLVGLVSWGEGCADPIFPGVNARVSAVYNWIQELVCELSEDPPQDFHCFPEEEQEEQFLKEEDRILHWILFLATAILFFALMISKCNESKPIHNYEPITNKRSSSHRQRFFHFKPLERGDTEAMAESSFYGSDVSSSPEQISQPSRQPPHHIRQISTDSSTCSYQNGTELAYYLGSHHDADDEHYSRSM